MASMTHDKAKVYKMMRDNRIRYYAMADYSDGAELDELIKAIIDRTAKNEALESETGPFAAAGRVHGHRPAVRRLRHGGGSDRELS